MKKLCLIILISIAAFSCGPKKSNINTHFSARALKKRKDDIDKISTKGTDSLLVFVKMTGREQLVRIFNGKFPKDSIECTYNVLLKKGRPLMIMLSPYDESGDYDVDYRHYFYDDGHTFAFEKRANAFGDLPNDNVIRETTTNYYNEDFKRLKHSYKLVDYRNKPLGKEYAFDRGEYDNKTYPTAEACLQAYRIKL